MIEHKFAIESDVFQQNFKYIESPFLNAGLQVFCEGEEWSGRPRFYRNLFFEQERRDAVLVEFFFFFNVQETITDPGFGTKRGNTRSQNQTSAPLQALSMILLSSEAMASSSSKPANAEVACKTVQLVLMRM